MMHHRFVDLDGGMGQMKTRTLQDHAASPQLPRLVLDKWVQVHIAGTFLGTALQLAA